MGRILLVEDDIAISQLYKIKLEIHDHTVLQAFNGRDALNHLTKFTPDIILLDLRLPFMSGDKFLEKLRQMPDHELTPVIVLTNVSRDEAPRTLWHLNISGYFVKAHHTPAELVEIVASHLEN